MEMLLFLKVVVYTISLIVLIMLSCTYLFVFEWLEKKDKIIAAVSLVLLSLICICSKP